MRPLRRILAPTLLLVLAALAVAGCGGSSAPKTASRADYASALNRFCATFKQGAATVQSESAKIPRGTSQKQALAAFARAIDTYATTIRSGLAKLNAVTPPPAYASFDSGATKGFRDVAVRLEGVAGDARRGDAKVLSQVGQRLSSISVPNPPADLQRQASDCNG